MSAKNIMRKILGVISAGIFLMLPIVVIIVILGKLYQILIGPTQKISAAMGIERPFLVQLVLWIILLIICFIFGLLIKAKAVAKARDLLESTVLRFVPGYEFMKLRLMIMLGSDEKAEQRSVLVRIDDGWSPAFLIEEGKNGNCVVFVPDVPKSSSGSVYVVGPEQVKHLHIKFKELDLAIRNYGKGLLDIYEGAEA